MEREEGAGQRQQGQKTEKGHVMLWQLEVMAQARDKR